MTQTGPSSGIGAHCPEAIGGYCRAFLLRVVVRRGGKLSYRSQFFSPPMKTVFAELSGDGLRQAHRPTKVIIGSPCACSRSACEPLNERKARRLRSPGYRSETQAPFSQFYFVGKDSNVMVSPFGAWIESQQSMPTSFPYGRCMNGSCSQRTKTTA
jgi:hypothetical protein